MESISFNPKFTTTNRITAWLTRIERVRGFLEAATLYEDWVREMGSRALVLEAHHTTYIEGARLTKEEAERLWRGGSASSVDTNNAIAAYRRSFEPIECETLRLGTVTSYDIKP